MAKSNESADIGEDVKCAVILCYQFGAPLIPVDRSSKTSNATHHIYAPSVASIGGNK